MRLHQPTTTTTARPGVTAADVAAMLTANTWEAFDALMVPGRATSMPCYTLRVESNRVCTAEFDHDGVHVAHGPDGTAVETWERTATDRTATEHEQIGARVPTAARERAAAAASIQSARESAARYRRTSEVFRRAGSDYMAEADLRTAELWETEAANLAVTYGLPLDVDPLALVVVAPESGWTLR